MWVVFWWLDVGLAVVFGSLIVVYLLRRDRSYWRTRRADIQKKVDESSRAIPKDILGYANLRRDTVDCAAAGVLLEQLRSLYDDINTSSKNTEAKANTILGFLGGGIGIVAAVTGFKTEASNNAPFTLGFGIFVLACSLLASILCLRAERRRGLPEIVSAHGFVERGVLNEGLTKNYLAYAWQARLYNLSFLNSRKAQRMEAAQTLFAGGAICVAFSYALTLFHPQDPKKSHLKCSSIDVSKSILQSDSFKCDLGGEK